MRPSTRPVDNRPAGRAGAVDARRVSRARLGAREKVLYGGPVTGHATAPNRRPPFGRLLREARVARGWLQQDVLDRTRIGRATLIRWENKPSDPTPADVIPVIDVLGISRVEAFLALGWLRPEDLADLDKPSPEQIEEWRNMRVMARRIFEEAERRLPPEERRRAE